MHRSREAGGPAASLLTQYEADDEDARAAIHRALRILELVRSRIDVGDRELISVSTLDEIATSLDQARAQVAAYVANSEASYIDQLDGHIDAILRATFLLPATPDMELRAAEGEIALLRELAINESLAIREMWKKSNDPIVSKQEELTSRITDAEEGMAVFAKEFEALRTASAEALEGEAVRNADAIASFQALAKAETEDVMTHLRRMQADAEELVGVIARTGMTAGYQEFEKEERAAATHWRRVAVYFALAAILVLAAGFTIALAASDGLEAHENLAGGALTATILGVATYAARQAARHNDNAVHARNTAIALSSIGPYLEGLGERSERDEILKAFAYLFFGHKSSPKVDEIIGPAYLQGMIGVLKRKADG